MSVHVRGLRTWIAAPLISMIATTASPQDSASTDLKSVLTPGSRVRLVSSAVGARMEGTVVAVDDKELTLVPEDRPSLKLTLSSISEMDLSMGRRRHWRRGLLIGAAMGVLLGAFDATAPVDEDFCGGNSENFCSRGEAIATMTAGSAVLGAGIGALIKSDRWAPVRLGRPTVGSDRRGFGVTLAVRF